MSRQAHREMIRKHFDSIAPDFLRWKRMNSYYNDHLIRWCRSRVPPGRRVLDFGCGRGGVLAALDPLRGTGIDLSGEMIRRAEADYPHLEFEQAAIEEFRPRGEYDAVLCVNTLEYTWDVGAVLDKIHSLLRDNGRLLIATGNPLWSPIFQLASSWGLRMPECARLFLTNKDLENMLALHGFDVVDSRMALPVPKPIPVLGPFLNWLLPRLPLASYLLCSTQLITARKVPPVRKDYAVSIIVPCHNEAGNVDRCVRETEKLGTRTELIFVDDGSTDGTAQAVRPELNPELEVKAIRYAPNRGKGRAVQTGFEASTGDIVMVLDADLTTHPSELGPLYEAFASGRAEFVNCSRFIYPGEKGSMRLANYMGNRFFAVLVSLVMEARVSDTLCGTKAMFRRDYDHMTMGRDPWGDYDLLFGAAQQRLVIRELPVHYRERRAGYSKMKTLRHTVNLLRMCWHGFRQVKTLRPLPPSRRSAAPGRDREQAGARRETACS